MARILGPIEALRDLWGRRTALRRTNGTPARSRAVIALQALKLDLDRWAEIKGNPDLRMPEFAALPQWMLEAWSGEFGWDTDQLLKAIEGATAVRQNPMARPDLNDGP